MNEDNLYARFITGELTKQEETLLKKNGEWEKLERIARVSSEFSIPAMNKKEGFAKLTEQRTSKEPKRRSLLSRAWMPIAASLLLLLGVLFLFNSNSVTTISAPLASKAEHTFSDGSYARLNSESKITFDDKKWDEGRTVDLDGEGYFKVEKGAPFKVVIDKGMVEVLGTEFNVKVRNQKLIAECYEGKVRVSYLGKEKILEAGQGVIISEAGLSEVQLSKEMPEWTVGRSQFRDEAFSEVCKELERQYKIKVISNVEDVRFSGIFVHFNLSTAVDQIAKPLGLKAVLSEDKKQVTFTN